MIIAEKDSSDIVKRTSSNGYHITTFEAIFDGCTFPSLQSLDMRNFTMKAEECNEFLDRVPTLLHLNIDGCLFTEGLWEDVAIYIKPKPDSPQLPRGLLQVSLNKLSGGFESPYEDIIWVSSLHMRHAIVSSHANSR